jgi:glutamyl-tRNA reductase
MPFLHLYGIDHSRASLAVREDLVFEESEIRELLPAFVPVSIDSASGAGVLEVMLLSTCNRTEVYLVLEREPGPYPLGPLRQYRQLARVMDDDCIRYHLTGSSVVSHLYAVASAIRSEVPGDTQIARQIASAGRIARSCGTLGPLLTHAVDGALRAAKRVRRETGLAAGSSTGIGPAVLRNLRRLASHSDGAKPAGVLLLGAGALAEDVATHLTRSAASSAAPRTAHSGAKFRLPPFRIAGVWARDRQKTIRFAGRYGIKPLSKCEALTALSQVDCVVGTCRGRVEILQSRWLAPIIERRSTPLTIIDLGVPRNLEPSLAARDGIDAVFLDELHQQIKDRTRLCNEAVAQAEIIVSEEVRRFERWLRQYPFRAVRADIYGVIEAALARWRGRHPAMVQRLRASLHKTLHTTFQSGHLECDPTVAINQ